MLRLIEVGVCGGGLLMAGIVAGLQAQKGFRVSQLGSSLIEAAPAIRMLAPQMMIFDMKEGGLAEVGALLRENQKLTLIGLEGETGTIAVFTATGQTIESGEELARFIAAGQKDEE
jgi:hypothetical protein